MLLEGLQGCCGGCFASIFVPKSPAGDTSPLLVSISFPLSSSPSRWGDIIPARGNVLPVAPEPPPSLHPSTWALLTAPRDLVRLVTTVFAMGTPTPDVLPTPPGSSPSSQCHVHGVPHPKIFRISPKLMICPNPAPFPRCAPLQGQLHHAQHPGEPLPPRRVVPQGWGRGNRLPHHSRDPEGWRQRVWEGASAEDPAGPPGQSLR